MSCITSTEDARNAKRTHRHGSVWLVGGRVAIGPGTAVKADIGISGGRILSIGIRPECELIKRAPSRISIVDLTGYLILPGLINSHDHLEFNLFPRLGRRVYSNYRKWASDIYRPNESPLREHLAVQKAVRLWWGGVKNLLSGVTTVSHHNPYVPEVFENAFPVRVVKRFAWAHSVAFGENFGPPAARTDDAPYIIHAGEGTDAESSEEVYILDQLGLLNSQTVIVHGVASEGSGLALLEIRGAGLVWCPTSNIFTLGRTLSSHAVNTFRHAVLGSDSALTAQGDLLDEIQFAHRVSHINPERLYSMVTDSAAGVLRLRDGEGSLRVGARADLIALKDAGKSPAETLMEMNCAQVEFSMLEGEPKLCSDELRVQWPNHFSDGLELVNVGEIRRWVRAPIAWMLDETRKHLGNNVRLAGRGVRA